MGGGGIGGEGKAVEKDTRAQGIKVGAGGRGVAARIGKEVYGGKKETDGFNVVY